MAQETLIQIFQPTLEKTSAWIERVRELADLEDERQAYVLTRAVLHVLRDRLTVDESADLASQLPLALKGVYFDGWKPAKSPVPIHKRQAFLDAVHALCLGSLSIDVESGTHAVLAALRESVPPGQFGHVRRMLHGETRDPMPA